MALLSQTLNNTLVPGVAITRELGALNCAETDCF